MITIGCHNGVPFSLTEPCEIQTLPGGGISTWARFIRHLAPGMGKLARGIKPEPLNVPLVSAKARPLKHGKKKCIVQTIMIHFLFY